jgi:hypothetical protein
LLFRNLRKHEGGKEDEKSFSFGFVNFSSMLEHKDAFERKAEKKELTRTKEEKFPRTNFEIMQISG